MEKNEQAIPQARTKDIVTRDMADEVLVYDLNNHKAHCLNHTAATVWKYCDGKASVPEIAAQLKSDFNPAVDEPTVWLAIKQLSKAHLLQGPIAPPTTISRLGRRAAIHRIGLSGVIALPLVMSIVAPTAMAACTGRSLVNAGCVSSAACCSNCCGGGTQANKTCQNPSSLPNGTACSASCACASGCCKSNNSGGSGQDTCQSSGGAVICFP
jgi:Coenzyme PQQ synthesis protein D (PqqD)